MGKIKEMMIELQEMAEMTNFGKGKGLSDMDYYELQQDRLERRSLDELRQLRAACSEAYDSHLESPQSFAAFDDSTEITVYMRPYIQAILSLADRAFDGEERARDQLLANVYRMQMIYKTAVDDMVEDGFRYYEEH